MLKMVSNILYDIYYIYIFINNLHLFNWYSFYFKDKDEIHNNPNLHSEEQNELEIPDYIEKNRSDVN